MRGARGLGWLAVALLGLGVPGHARVPLPADPSVTPTRSIQDEGPRARQVLQIFREWLGRSRPEEAAIAVVHRGRLVGQDGAGGRDAKTPARIASLSKAITALCISRLIDGGRLRYDSTIGEVLGPFIARAGPPADPRLLRVTVGQMLGHRSGIRRASPLVGIEGGVSRGMRSSLEEQVKRAFSLPLDFQPGARFSYSNQGYIALGLIVEQVTGENYETACRSRVFRPIGVTSAIIGRSPTQQARAPAGGWTVSALDYARFVETLRPDAPGFGPATRRWLAARWAAPRPYGLGYFARGAGAATMISHNGLIDDADTSISAQFMSYPAGWTVVINTRPARPQAIAGLERQINTLFGFAEGPPPGRSRPRSPRD